MNHWIIYHNPRCSKSREALELLKAREISPTIIEYLVQVPSVEDLRNLLCTLAVPAKDLVRTKESVFQEKPFDLSDEDLVLQRISENPVLLERPIVLNKKRGVIARPPDLILNFFEI